MGLVKLERSIFINEWFMVLYIMLVRISFDVFISKLVIIKMVLFVVKFVVEVVMFE